MGAQLDGSRRGQGQPAQSDESRQRATPSFALRRLDRRDVQSLWLGAFTILLFNAILLAWILLKPASHARFVAVDDILGVLGPVLALPVCFFAGRRNRPQRGDSVHAPFRSVIHGWTPYLFGFGILGFALGEGIWTYYELVLNHPTPFPSLADAGYLIAYPFFFLGILLLPVRRVSITSRTRVLLDGLVVMCAVATFSWYYVLGPTLMQGGESTLAKIVGTAYPVCDLVLVFCLLLLAVHSGDRSFRPVIRILSLGLAIIVVTDTLFDYETLRGTYASGGLLDVGWPLGYMLIGLGALAARLLMKRDSEVSTEAALSGADGAHDGPSSRSPIFRSLAPYVLLAAVGALMVYSGHVRAHEAQEPGVYIGGALLIALVCLRQILVILENSQLYRETVVYATQLHTAQEELRSNNEALAEANKRLEALATSDPLTGLLNHRAMVAALDHELERAHRYNRPFALLFIDIDHFKALNDGCGHSVGDGALREFASVVGAALRGADVLGRWGGEEFLAILPETDGDAAADVAERVRSIVAGHTLATVTGLRMTCSVGVACSPQDSTDRDSLIDAADRAMYAAKRLGRNQVRLTSDPAVGALENDPGTAGTREETALIGTVEALATLVQARDHYTGFHIDAVSRLSAKLGEWLGLPAEQVYALRLGGWLHDIGKVAISDAILQKPARLTEEEWVLMRTHPIVGADVVSRVPGLRMLAQMIRAHHERWDGHGYPDGLAGEEIPLSARIIAVADSFRAMTTERPYQRARSTEDALAEMRRCSGTQFDPVIVEALIGVLEEKRSTRRAV
jgi:diguanylate cyclase (GGDEF)-like protein